MSQEREGEEEPAVQQLLSLSGGSRVRESPKEGTLERSPAGRAPGSSWGSPTC